MTLSNDVVLPDVQQVSEEVSWSAYRLARKAALFAMRVVHGEILRIDGEVTKLIAAHGRKGVPGEVGSKLYVQVRFLELQGDFYRSRLVMLRGYQRYIRDVHGQP